MKLPTELPHHANVFCFLPDKRNIPAGIQLHGPYTATEDEWVNLASQAAKMPGGRTALWTYGTSIEDGQGALLEKIGGKCVGTHSSHSVFKVAVGDFAILRKQDGTAEVYVAKAA